MSEKSCRHCGTPFDPRLRPDSEFCCNGCAYVFQLIRREGLDHYYDLREGTLPPVASATLQNRDYRWLEKKAIEAEVNQPREASLILDIQGLSCIGCVWLIEKIFRRQAGAVRIDINAQYGQIRIAWRPGVFSPRQFAEDIQQFGYLVGPAGHRPRTESGNLISKIGLAGAFALNAMLFTLPRYLGMEADFQFARLFEWLAILFATLSLATCGSYFIRRGIAALVRGILHLDLPIALGIVLAWLGSLAGWLLTEEHLLYFDFVAIFIFLMLVGRYFQEKTLEANRHQLIEVNQAPTQALVVTEDLSSEEDRSLDSLRPGEIIRIASGETFPVRAELISRAASCSLEWINGESAMRQFQLGQHLPAGAKNIGLEPVLARVEERWEASILQKLLAGSEALGRNLPLERVLRRYLLIVLAVAGAGAFWWGGALGNPVGALQVAVSILVVSCPCALGIAWPLANEWTLLALRKHDVFVRQGDLFSRLGKVRQFLFDKTGTLTLESPRLANPDVLKTLSEVDRLALWTMVDTSLHPVSRALRDALILNFEGRSEGSLPGQLTETVGKGLTLTRSDSGFGIPDSGHLQTESGIPNPKSQTYQLGRPSWIVPDDNQSATVFARDGEVLARFHFEDALRTGTKEALASLRKRGPVYILSGDDPEKVRQLADELDLPADRAIGALSPEAKAKRIQDQIETPALFLGDGANDSLAFDAAEVKGTPVQGAGLLEAKADFYLTGHQLDNLLALFDWTAKRQTAIRRVLGFAISYNIAVVGIALAGAMHPFLAAILMPLSSILSIFLVKLSLR